MAIGLLEERRLTLASAPGPGQPRGAVRVDDRPRRDRRRVGPRLGDVRRRRALKAADRPGRRSVRREAADRGESRADRAGPRRGAPGPRRRRDHLRDVRDRRPGRNRDPRRPRRDPAARTGHGAVRGDDLASPRSGCCAIVRPDRWTAVREVCERWGLPVAIIGRVTGDGDVTVVAGGLDADGRPRPGRAELARIPAAALTSDAIVHDAARDATAAPPRGPAPGAAEEATADCPSGGWTRARCCWRSSAARTSSSRRWVYEQYDSSVQANTVAGPGHGAAVIRIKGTTQGPRRLDRRQPGRRGDRSLARRGAERRGGDPQRVDHRRPTARRDELPQLRRPDPAGGVLAAHRGRPRAGRRLSGARPAGDRRQRLALQRVAGRARSRRRPRSASSACSTTWRRSSGRRSSRPATRSSSSARRRRGSPAAPTPSSPAARREDGPPSLDLAREAAVQAFIREAIARGLVASAQDGRGGGLAVALAEGVHLGRTLGATLAAAGRGLAGRRAVRREPVAARLTLPAPARAGARPAGPPARPAGRGARRRSAATGSSSSWPAPARPVRPRSAARGSPTRSMSRSPTCATPGSTAWPGRSAGTAPTLGGAECAASSGPSLPGGRRAGGGRDRRAGPVRAPAPRPGVGRPGGQRRRAADALQGPRDDRPVLDERRLPSLRGDLAIAHCRYSTTGSTVWENAQPTFRLGPRRAVADGPQRQPRQHPRAARPAAAAAAPGCPRRPTRSS